MRLNLFHLAREFFISTLAMIIIVISIGLVILGDSFLVLFVLYFLRNKILLILWLIFFSNLFASLSAIILFICKFVALVYAHFDALCVSFFFFLSVVSFRFLNKCLCVFEAHFIFVLISTIEFNSDYVYFSFVSLLLLLSVFFLDFHSYICRRGFSRSYIQIVVIRVSVLQRRIAFSGEKKMHCSTLEAYFECREIKALPK